MDDTSGPITPEKELQASTPRSRADGAAANLSLGHTVKETVTAVIIAFVMTFVFRSFVMEAFLIPTGSMAPTLLGAHMRFTARESGYSWTVGPWDMLPDGITPKAVQGGAGADDPPVVVHDPMTGEEMSGSGIRTRWGDRIFVFKYLYSIFDPQRFDVVVFKNPRDPSVNYIKRLIGLPGEMLALVDGDVFSRTPRSDDDPATDRWSLPGWRICRKPDRAQLAMWQRLFSSEYTPLDDTDDMGRRWFVSPWIGVGSGPEGSDWRIEGRRTYEYSGQGPTRLAWNARERPVTDSLAYNESPIRASLHFPVSDVRMSMGFRPSSAGQRVTAFLEARGHTFRIDAGGGVLLMAMGPGTGKDVPFTPLAVEGEDSVDFEQGRTTDLEFWFVDQTLQLWRDGRRVAKATYEWTPRERMLHATGESLERIAAGPEFLVVEDNYRRPQLFLEFDGGPFTLSRVALDRDVHYQADLYRYHSGDGMSVHSQARRPALATHPLNTPTLASDEYFVCGDNSAQSLDSRLWDRPHPWISAIDPAIGVVPRDLLIGKAFFVYFPAPFQAGRIPVPDFGRMRFIW
ncbi:MAG: signal peptidase I [Phycisphaerae bacterium]|jgi:signal peptidase I